jgi:hypothetical protein
MSFICQEKKVVYVIKEILSGLSNSFSLLYFIKERSFWDNFSVPPFSNFEEMYHF